VISGATKEIQMKSLLVLVMAAITLTSFTPTFAEETSSAQFIQVAEIEIDPPQLESYKAAVKEQIEAAIRIEPGVLMLYSVVDRDYPAHITVFEIYRDAAAYEAHLQSAHFKKYKADTANMVKSLKLIRVNPIVLGSK